MHYSATGSSKINVLAVFSDSLRLFSRATTKKQNCFDKKETVLSISTLKLLSSQLKQACAKTSWTLMCLSKHLIMNLWCSKAVFLIVYVICANGDCQLHQYVFLCEASVFVLLCFLSLIFFILFGFQSFRMTAWPRKIYEWNCSRSINCEKQLMFYFAPNFNSKRSTVRLSNAASR